VAKYIEFKDDPFWKGGYVIINKRGHDELAKIRWDGAWRQFILYDVSTFSVWSAGCLDDVSAFLKGMNKEKQCR